MQPDPRYLPVCDRMPPISLEEMDAIRLMNRVDTKYVTNGDKLVAVLEDAAAAGYRICEIEGKRISGYNSLYYDTDGLQMYLAHHNGRKTRQKVRVRTYEVNGETYLEIKRKQNNGRTKKKRVRMDPDCFSRLADDAAAVQFLHTYSWFKVSELSPALTTEFNRITLVNPGRTERLTIDMQLHFTNYRNGREAGLGDAVIIELKQDGRIPSQMRNILLQHRIHPLRISKYCIGSVMTTPGLKANRFKERFHQLEKIANIIINK